MQFCVVVPYCRGDPAGADLAVHGHAHNGIEKGVTPGGVPVRNVALPALKSAYAVYCLAS